jgi:Zn-dependent M28 family amino/carboxypeptidase
MGVTLAKYFKSHQRPKHTRLVFVSFDAEELCLRGSREFFKKHRKEFHETKTWNFNVDCPYSVDEMKFLTSDINGLVKLSSKLAAKLSEIAHGLGYTTAMPRKIMPFGGGTDAAEAAKAGIEATCLVGIPYGAKDSRGRDNIYHTRRDTVDAVDREIVEGTMGIFLKFIDELDEGKLP